MRNVVERVFGVLKGRYQCLLSARELHYTPKKVLKVLNACVALHNICIKYKVDMDDGALLNENITNNNIDTALNTPNALRDKAKRIRDLIKDTL